MKELGRKRSEKGQNRDSPTYLSRSFERASSHLCPRERKRNYFHFPSRVLLNAISDCFSFFFFSFLSHIIVVNSLIVSSTSAFAILSPTLPPFVGRGRRVKGKITPFSRGSFRPVERSAEKRPVSRLFITCGPPATRQKRKGITV